MLKNIKIGKIYANLYLPDKLNGYEWGVIYLKGGPYSTPDNGKSPFYKTCEANNVALIVPDYIGYFRSDGRFSFKNCITTILKSKEFMEGSIPGHDYLTKRNIKISVKNIIVIGSSWSGAIVPFVDFFGKTNIKYIGLIKPVTDWTFNKNSKEVEEDLIKTRDFITNQYKNVYRGFANSVWYQIFTKPIKKYNPINNTHLLEGKTIYIIHGNKDKTIHWTNSFRYYNKLLATNSSKKIFWKLLQNYSHSEKTNIRSFDLIIEKFLNLSPN